MPFSRIPSAAFAPHVAQANNSLPIVFWLHFHRILAAFSSYSDCILIVGVAALFIATLMQKTQTPPTKSPPQYRTKAQSLPATRTRRRITDHEANLNIYNSR